MNKGAIKFAWPIGAQIVSATGHNCPKLESHNIIRLAGGSKIVTKSWQLMPKRKMKNREFHSNHTQKHSNRSCHIDNGGQICWPLEASVIVAIKFAWPSNYAKKMKVATGAPVNAKTNKES